jgi:hypothetical protein
MSDARMIWNDPHGEGRNRYVLFRRRFDLSGEPIEGEIHLFADTRYRLVVNGAVVGHGPARFFAAHPEYDTYPIAHLLRNGENVIAVTVNSYGTYSFHSEASLGGFLAWGRAADAAGNTVSLATGEAWKAIESPGHCSDTSHMSFALNQGEHLDARRMPAGWDAPGFDDSSWPLAVRQGRPGHWGAPGPRSIPLLDERNILPRRKLGVWAVRSPGDEDVYSTRITNETNRVLHARRTQAMVMTFLHSPRDQVVALGAWWGRYWVNGESLQGAVRADVRQRMDYAAHLKPGWNTLQVLEGIHNHSWTFLLAIPRESGVRLSAERKLDSPNVFLLAGPWETKIAEELDAPLDGPEDLPAEMGPWRPWARNRSAEDPCRERAWNVFAPLETAAGQDMGVDVPALAARASDNAMAILFDFGTEVLGRPVLTFTAAEGTKVDLSYTERLDKDGTAEMHKRPFVEMSERYVAREGMQQWRTFHPRGFRYMEALLRGDLRRFELLDVGVARAYYPVEERGRFECSDPVLNEIWKLGQATLRACMEDAYLDCPWRERGLYAGDLPVQFFVNLAVYGDTRLFRRCIVLFLQALGSNGLAAAGAHGLPHGRHPDYSAILPGAMWDYWAATGDADFLHEQLPNLKTLMNGLSALQRKDDDLFDGSELSPYIDLCHMDREGVNCALNCFYVHAFQMAARVYERVGEIERAAESNNQAKRLAAAIRREFWNPGQQVFVDRRKQDVGETEPSVPANVLPLLFDIADEKQAPKTLDWVLDAMKNNFRAREPQNNSDCNVTPYFSYYALNVLYRFGKARQAQEFIRTYWGRMLEGGAWTCWEYFLDTASRCHAWSASPTHYLSTKVLGVNFPQPGKPNLVGIKPNPGTLTWAEGVYPHPLGPIAVRWERAGDDIQIHCDLPEGIERISDPE